MAAGRPHNQYASFAFKVGKDLHDSFHQIMPFAGLILSPDVGCPRLGILDLVTDRLESIEILSLEIPLRQREGFVRQSE